MHLYKYIYVVWYHNFKCHALLGFTTLKQRKGNEKRAFLPVWNARSQKGTETGSASSAYFGMRRKIINFPTLEPTEKCAESGEWFMCAHVSFVLLNCVSQKACTH